MTGLFPGRDGDETSAIALYLHIPFCKRKCAYCDFASYAGREEAMARYCGALTKEMADAANRFGKRAVDSVFIGGGTPTLLSGEQAESLLGAARARFDLLSMAEITMEGNPGTLRREDVAGYLAAGVNRFSLGAQASQPRLLEVLGRIHRWQDVESGVAMLRDAGCTNINLDLMFGLPGQSLGDWMDSLRAALALTPEHLSCYALQVEEGTPLAARLKAGECPALPGEDEERAMYAQTRRMLAKAGYEQYELSNFARPGRQCRQNMAYWTRRDYIGMGCAAHSLMKNQRWGNTASLAAYLAAAESGGSPVAERTELDDADARFEALMLGLRLTGGISSTAFARRYGCSIQALWGDKLTSLASGGLVEWSGERLRLTERGMDLQNSVLVALMD